MSTIGVPINGYAAHIEDRISCMSHSFLATRFPYGQIQLLNAARSPPTKINNMKMAKMTEVMVQEIIPQIIPALVESLPSGSIVPPRVFMRSPLPIIQAGIPVNKPHKTKLRMLSTRINVRRWDSKSLRAVPNWDGLEFMTR